jgi:hypothetical protein
MDLIDFDVEKNKKNITRLQKIKWRLNSRWPPKIVFGLESTNMHFFQNAFFSSLFLSIADFLWKNFFLLNPKWRLVSRWRFCHFKITLFSKNPLQAITNTKTKVLMDLLRIYNQQK